MCVVFREATPWHVEGSTWEGEGARGQYVGGCEGAVRGRDGARGQYVGSTLVCLSVHREMLRRPASMTTEASGRIYKNMYIFLRNLQKYVHLFSIQSTQALAKPLWLKGGAHSR